MFLRTSQVLSGLHAVDFKSSAHNILFSLFEFRENQRREGPTFVICLSEIIYTPVPSDLMPF